jgi:hypothetical protein
MTRAIRPRRVGVGAGGSTEGMFHSLAGRRLAERSALRHRTSQARPTRDGS